MSGDHLGWGRAAPSIARWLVLGCWLSLLCVPPVAHAAGALAGRTIVLNAEEGGSNPGGVVEGVEEKTINLATTLDVGALLTQAGARVVYTRTADVAVSLQARTAAANQANADAFITVAANALNDPAISGVVTYFGGPSGYAGGQTRPAALVAGGQALAQAVQAGVVRTTGAIDRGAQSADFYVLGYATMPAILIETGFMTNPAELQRLVTPRYQEAVAAGIVAGLARFFGGSAAVAAGTVARAPTLGAVRADYTVRPGDTLSGLAARFGVSVQALLRQNGLGNANDLVAGQALTVPTGAQEAPALALPTTGYPGGAGQGYVVRPGDTLSGLALRFGVSAAALMRMNNLPNQDRIVAGTTLCVPAR